MKVQIVDYDAQWARDFVALRAHIWRVVKDIAVSIEHVGSTSVPGLSAKRFWISTSLLGIEGREAFRASLNEPTHNLYVCHQDSAALRDHLTFRDFLRTRMRT